MTFENQQLDPLNFGGTLEPGVKVVHHRFGAGSAVLVGACLLVAVGFLVWKNLDYFGIYPRLWALPTFQPTYIAGSNSDLQEQLSGRGDLPPVRPSRLLNRSWLTETEEWAWLGVRDALVQFESQQQLQNTDVLRVARQLRSTLEQEVIFARIDRDHAALAYGTKEDLVGFLSLYSDNRYAKETGYLLSAETMLHAANNGSFFFASEGKDSVDNAFERIETGGTTALASFLSKYGANRYAIRRGYVDQALTKQKHEHDENLNRQAEREKLLKLRQQSARWDLE